MRRGSRPAPAIAVSPAADCGSLLEAATENEESPDPDSTPATVATSIIFLFGGQMLQPGAGRPEIDGAVLSIEKVSVRGDSALPARSTAKYLSVLFPSAPSVIVPPEPTLPERVSAPLTS